MSESKALFFFTEEWDPTATDEHLLSVMHVILTGRVTEEMRTSSIPTEQWDDVMRIMHTDRFIGIVQEYFSRTEESVLSNPEHLNTIRELRHLVMLFIRQGMDEDVLLPHTANAYFTLLADMVEFYENTYTFVLKRNENLERTEE